MNTPRGFAFLLVLPLASCAGQGAGPAPAPSPTETAAFIATLGGDTVSGERFTLAGSRLSGEAFTRSPRTVIRHYDATLRPDGSIQRVEVTARTLNAPPTTPPTVTTVEFTTDSAHVRIARGDSVVTLSTAARYGSIPLVSGSYALYEVSTRHLRRLGRDRGEFTLLVPGSQSSPTFQVEMSGGSGVISNVAGRSRVELDEAGRLLELDGAESTQKVKVQRLPDAGVAALAAAFAQREAAGRGLGVLSPRDSAVLELAGARIVVDYGRPALRGREVMGEIVPWDQVWRTGANAATGLRTTRDLTLAGTRIPAGAYTLYTVPTRSGWTLIVNRQTGQWGTEYHAEQDLARVNLTQGTAATPVEVFTIALARTGDSTGELRLAWGDIQLAAPFTVH